MPKVALSHGYEAIVDAKDYPRVNSLKWYAMKHPRTGKVYANTNLDGTIVGLHRFLVNALPFFDVDHRDGNTMNYRRRNLRICLRSQNMANIKAHKDSTSGFKGVSWRKSANKWEARIMVSGKRYELGRFKTAEEAASAYNQAALKFFGSFARLNIIDRQGEEMDISLRESVHANTIGSDSPGAFCQDVRVSLPFTTTEVIDNRQRQPVDRLPVQIWLG